VAWFADVFTELTQPRPEQAAGDEPAAVAIDAALADAVSSVPGAAELSEEQLAEVMAEVRARLQSAEENAS
jgi:hypothetical protein